MLAAWMSFVSLDVGPGPSTGLATDTLHWGNMKHATVFTLEAKRRNANIPMYELLAHLIR